jgi:molybdate transport system ATP-binding protein
MVGDRVSWRIRPENIGLVNSKNIIFLERRSKKPARWCDKEYCELGTSHLVSIILKDSGAILNVEVTNHVFNSLKISTGDKCMVRIRTSI